MIFAGHFLLEVREAPFEMCYFNMGIARKEGGVKACQDCLGHFFPTFSPGARVCQGGLGHFFSTFARLTEGGGV